MTFTIELRNAEAMVHCAIEGDLDLASQDDALAQLLPLIDQPSPVVLDLSKVEFIDSTGLRVLLKCRHEAEENGTRFLLGPVGSAVERLFAVTKIGVAFDRLPGSQR